MVIRAVCGTSGVPQTTREQGQLPATATSARTAWLRFRWAIATRHFAAVQSAKQTRHKLHDYQGGPYVWAAAPTAFCRPARAAEQCSRRTVMGWESQLGKLAQVRAEPMLEWSLSADAVRPTSVLGFVAAFVYSRL